MNINFTLSILLAIPIGILANLLTPRIQRWIEQKSEEGRKKRREQLLEEYTRIKSFKENRHEYYVFLLVVSLKVTFLYAVRSIFNTVIHMIPNSVDLFYELGNTPWSDLRNMIWRITSLLDSLIALTIVLIVFNLVRDALGVAMKVREFVTYEQYIINENSSNNSIQSNSRTSDR